MRTHVSCLLTFVFLVLGSFTTLVFPDDMLHPVEILVITTSDWTDVRFIGGSLVVQSYEILEGSEAPGLQVVAGSTVSIGKSSYDQTRIAVRITAYLADLAETWIRISINKGHIGATTISFHAEDDEAFASFTHTGIVQNDSSGNIRIFYLRTSEITSRVAVQIVEAPSETSVGGRKVLAFYYPWYGTPDGPSGRWVHWNPNQSNYASTHIPASGYYDSLDPDAVRRHIREAKAADIDGFIASWWGIDSFEDRAFEVLLHVAEEEDFLVVPYYEDAKSLSQIVADIGFIVSRYSGSPAFLEVEDRPVIFFYVRVMAKFSLTQWASAFASLNERGRIVFAIADSLQSEYLSVFQGLHTYNPVGMSLEITAEQYASASLAARLQDALFAATVLPGYQEAVFRMSSPVADRANGETYHTYWNIARASKPHWVLITSFNEWHEGSEIESSVEFGTTYLTLTAEEAGVWRSDETAPTNDGSGDRDSDGVPDEIDYCPDWPGSEITNGC